MEVGRVAALWRYPVKSMLGERLERAHVGSLGVEGDRAYAVIDTQTGHALSAKRVQQLLRARARTTGDAVTVTLPDGVTLPAADAGPALSDWLGRPVHVARVSPGTETTVDGDGRTFRTPPGTFFDGGEVHLVTTATLDDLARLRPSSDFDARRFRPNIVIATQANLDGAVERSWMGEAVAIGDVLFDVWHATGRCVVTTAAQEELARDREVLATVARERDNIVGVYARPRGEGNIAAGDPVFLTGS